MASKNLTVRKYRRHTRRRVGVHRLHQRSPRLVRLARGSRGSHLRVRPGATLHPRSVAHGCGDSGKRHTIHFRTTFCSDQYVVIGWVLICVQHIMQGCAVTELQ